MDQKLKMIDFTLISYFIQALCDIWFVYIPTR